MNDATGNSTGNTSDRLTNVLDSLNDARKSFENWEDQRTQALINLDSFTFDVQLLQEEKNQILEEYKKAQSVYHQREATLQAQLAQLSDQVQGLISKSENAQKDLEIARIHTAAAKAETEKQVHAQRLIDEKYQIEVSKVKAEAEARSQSLRREDAMAIEKLNHQVQQLMMDRDRQVQQVCHERDRQESRARKSEQELANFKNHIQNLLNQTHAIITGTTPAQVSPAQISPASFDLYSGSEEVLADEQVSQPQEKPARELVQDYLKRLGY